MKKHTDANRNGLIKVEYEIVLPYTYLEERLPMSAANKKTPVRNVAFFNMC